MFPRDRIFPGIRRTGYKPVPTETQWFAFFGITKVFFPYKPFTGRYGSGSDETQPVKQYSQGGALGMELLTCPAAVHYRLLVAKVRVPPATQLTPRPEHDEALYVRA